MTEMRGDCHATVASLPLMVASLLFMEHLHSALDSAAHQSKAELDGDTEHQGQGMEAVPATIRLAVTVAGAAHSLLQEQVGPLMSHDVREEAALHNMVKQFDLWIDQAAQLTIAQQQQRWRAARAFSVSAHCVSIAQKHPHALCTHALTPHSPRAPFSFPIPVSVSPLTSCTPRRRRARSRQLRARGASPSSNASLKPGQSSSLTIAPSPIRFPAVDPSSSAASSSATLFAALFPGSDRVWTSPSENDVVFGCWRVCSAAGGSCQRCHAALVRGATVRDREGGAQRQRVESSGRRLREAGRRGQVEERAAGGPAGRGEGERQAP
eukprot:1774437-Rhodomonas_salina.3